MANGRHETSRSWLKAAKRDNKIAAAFAGLSREKMSNTKQPQSPLPLLQEIRGYLLAAADGSMSRNNSEQLASELLSQVDGYIDSAHNVSTKHSSPASANDLRVYDAIAANFSQGSVRAKPSPLTEEQRRALVSRIVGFDPTGIITAERIVVETERAHGIYNR